MDELTYQAEGRTEMLKERTKRCVCKHCGGRLRLKQLIFSEHDAARVEIFCKTCDRIEFGVEQEIYESAKYFVDQTKFDYFPDLEDSEKTRRMNIAKVCEVMTWENKSLGFLGRDGFTVKPQKAHYMGEMLHLTDEDLDDIVVVSVDAPSE